MTSPTLTDRYVYATTRTLREPERDEIARELRAEIDDMAAARVEAGAATADAERLVLAELGDPERLAARYAERPLHLIGPSYFLLWRRVLRTLLTFVPAILGVLAAAGHLIDGGEVLGAAAAGVGAAFSIAIHLAFWTTLTFAVVERYGSRSATPGWSVDDLPELPSPSSVGAAETLGAIAIAMLTIFLIAWQQLSGVVATADGGRVPLFDEGLWSSWIPVILVALAAEAAVVVAAHRRGRWTWPLVAGFGLASVASAAPLMWLLSTEALIDPRFVAEVAWLGEGDHLDQLSVAVIVGIGFITAMDIVGKARAAIRS